MMRGAGRGCYYADDPKQRPISRCLDFELACRSRTRYSEVIPDDT